MEGVDYAWDRPDLDQLYAAGKRFVCRYLAKLPNGKVLTSTELQALHRKGFGVVLNWEQAAGDMVRLGYSGGVAHAAEALRQADALGAPDSVPIYFSCDVDTDAASRLAVARYLDGCASVLGHNRVGVYGEADVIDAMLPTHAAWGWQTYAWSGGRVSAKAHFLQYRNGVTLAGANLDLNRTLQATIGAWFPGAKEDDMGVEIFKDVPQDATSSRLSQGPAGVAGQQRDTAIGWTWAGVNTAVAKLDAALAKLDVIAGKVDIDAAELAAIESAAKVGAGEAFLDRIDQFASALAAKLSSIPHDEVVAAVREVFADAGA